ncbi:redoxin domain-containing protein [Spirulina subsalsa FACHB-351]|uniref:Thioredoxin n=1 Tax=Spirulina subsalsa FACHB-351 TaxID=234711 RepID=A0ABT3L5S3_9CYAN|nr:thioredoxin domain-containing protein [Spirulina subsalsa]MCW6036847.1 redoxin domain-containing protein [Spirulina subsalsa FACHB-351]
MSQVIVISDAEFEQAVYDQDKPVLAYFWAAWCGPCRLVSPSIEELASKYGDRLKVVKLEVDPNPEAVKACQVKGVPALRLFKGKETVLSHEGAIGKQALFDLLTSHLN